MKTKQDVFYTVGYHLLKQGNPAIARTGDARCMYLIPKTGEKCAVGCLIPADRYMEVFEGCALSSSRFPTNPLRDVLDDLGLLVHLDLLKDLQALHDQTSGGDLWHERIREGLARIAENHQLKPYRVFRDETSGAAIHMHRWYAIGDAGGLAASFDGFDTCDACMAAVQSQHPGATISTEPSRLGDVAISVLTGQQFVDRLGSLDNLAEFGHWE